MIVSRAEIARALGLIKGAEGQAYNVDGFSQLQGAIHIQGVQGHRIVIAPRVRAASWDFWSMLTTLQRSLWQIDAARGLEQGLGALTFFIGADVEQFHTTLRSLFDEVASIVASVGAKPRQVPETSFEKLRNWVLTEDRAPSLLGADLARLIREAEWFESVRKVRDDILHRSAMALGFVNDNRPCFQVFLGTENTVAIRELMANENIVYFDDYAALFTARTMLFMDGFADILKPTLGLDTTSSHTIFMHPGLNILRHALRRIDRLVEAAC